MGAVVHLIDGDQTHKKQLANTVAGTGPAEPVAPRAGGEAVVHRDPAALLTLDDMVYLPVPIGLLAPASVLERERVTAKWQWPLVFAKMSADATSRAHDALLAAVPVAAAAM